MPRFDLNIKISYASLILEFATWRGFDSSGICVLTYLKEVSRREVLGDPECHFVHPHVSQIRTSGPTEGTPGA